MKLSANFKKMRNEMAYDHAHRISISGPDGHNLDKEASFIHGFDISALLYLRIIEELMVEFEKIYKTNPPCTCDWDANWQCGTCYFKMIAEKALTKARQDIGE